MPAKTAPAVTSDMKPVQEQLSCTFAERNSQQQYGELVSVDRFSFNQVAASHFIRSAMRDMKLIELHLKKLFSGRGR